MQSILLAAVLGWTIEVNDPVSGDFVSANIAPAASTTVVQNAIRGLDVPYIQAANVSMSSGVYEIAIGNVSRANVTIVIHGASLGKSSGNVIFWAGMANSMWALAGGNKVEADDNSSNPTTRMNGSSTFITSSPYAVYPFGSKLCDAGGSSGAGPTFNDMLGCLVIALGWYAVVAGMLVIIVPLVVVAFGMRVAGVIGRVVRRSAR